MQTIELARLIAPVLLFVMMIGMGLGLRRKDFVDLLQAPIGVAIGTLGQVLLLPLMGLWVNWVFALDGTLALGVIVLCLCPGGVASNTITYLLKGDVALSISLTVISSCIAFISVPLLVALALAHYGVLGQTVQLPMADTVVRLFLLTLLPLALGMGLARLWPTACKRLEPLLRILGFAFLMLMILVVVVKEFPLLQAYAARLASAWWRCSAAPWALPGWQPGWRGSAVPRPVRSLSRSASRTVPWRWSSPACWAVSTWRSRRFSTASSSAWPRCWWSRCTPLLLAGACTRPTPGSGRSNPSAMDDSSDSTQALRRARIDRP